MGASELFIMSYVDVKTPVTDLNIYQIQNWTASPNIAPMLLKGAGEEFFTFLAQDGIAPVLSVSATDVSTILAATGLKGVRIYTGEAAPGVIAYLKQMTEGGTRMTGSNHMSLTITEGYLAPRTVTATDGGGPAVVSLDAICTYDGTNLPITIASGVAISATPAASIAYGVGPISVNGTALDGVVNVTIDCGNSIVTQKGDNEIAPTFCARMSHSPSVVLTCSKASYLATCGITAATQGATDTVIYLRKFARHSGRVANNATEHIKLTMDDGNIEPMDSSFALDAAGLVAFRLVPVYDGTNEPLVLSTTSAIT